MQHSQRAAADSPDTGPWLAAFDERWPGLRRRAAGIALALLLEVGLLLLLLTLGRSAMGDREAADSLTTVDFAPEPPAPDAPPEPDEAAAPSAPAWQHHWERAVDALGVPVFRMPSGAGHDAMKLHEIMPQAMLFVRGQNSGISHNPLESTTNNDMQLAVDAFTQVLRQLAEEPQP